MRLKLVPAASTASIVLAILACEVLSPTTGSIRGKVVIEGHAVPGVVVSLGSGFSTNTTEGGEYRFDDVEGGTYAVTISGFPDDAIFDSVSGTAVIESDGQVVILDFRGSYIRTASIMGRVTVDEMPLARVSVRLSGVSDALTATDDVGHFVFPDLRGGAYTIRVSGLEDVEFPNPTQSVTVGVGEFTVLVFEGAYIRTASILGTVAVEDMGLGDVTVRLTGMDQSQTATDANGRYEFNNLRAGTYTIRISGFDTDEIGFGSVSSSATVGVGESRIVSFDGTYHRTASILGMVTVDNMGFGGVTVRLSGIDEAQTTTDANGRYEFNDLRAGTYTIGISGFNTDEIGFGSVSYGATVGVGESEVISFEGTSLRTAGIMGQVSVDGTGLPGVTVSLSGGEEDATTTDDSGQYAFAKLRAGDYSVGISGYDEDAYGFEVTSRSVSVALGEKANVPFEGNLLRTAGISGRVAVEGTGIEGVTVTLSGAGDDTTTTTTDASGQYGFAGLVEGDYTVAISGYDEVAYTFETTSADVTVGDSESKIQNFDGRHAR